MTSIRDLAQHLDVSIGTISRALNGKPDVSDKTRKRVQEAALELGYFPSQAGRSLRKGASNVVGLVIESNEDVMSHGDLFFIRVMSGMQSVLSEFNLHVVMFISPPDEQRDSFIQSIVARGFTDALILTSVRRQDPRIEFLAKSGTPFLTLGRSETDGGQSWIDLDFEGMVRDAMSRFSQVGHERIGLVVPDFDLNLVQLVLQTYREMLGRLNIQYDPSIIFRTDDDGYKVVDILAKMDKPPTALILSDQLYGFGLYRGFANHGIEPGTDISLVGLGARLTNILSPALSHYRVGLFELGQHLAQLLLRAMEEKERGSAPSIVRDRAAFHFVEGVTICRPKSTISSS